MLGRLQALRIRTQLLLLSGIMVAGFAVFGIMCFATIAQIRVNGPIYSRIIQGKDVTADILPPPLYIVETYLTAMQAADEKDPARHRVYVERIKSLRDEYERSHARWEKELPPGALKDTLLKTSYEPATTFYGKVEKEFLPALSADNAQKASIVKGELAKLYETHRAAIDEVVKRATDQNARYESSAGNTINTMVTILAIIALTTILVALAMAFATIRAITKPLGKAVCVSEEIARGNLQVTIDANGESETGRLLSAMKTMTESIKAMMEDVRTSADSVVASSEQMSASSNQMSGGLSEQSERISQIASASTEMAQTLTDIAQNASSMARAAAEAASTAESGSSIVDTSVKEVTAIATTIAITSNAVGSLGEKSRQIGEIVNVIKDIADQTNLLALNAAIEAARAGEQGRGFAVVADEVRKLAERTTRATAEIGDMIRVIQKEVEQAVGSMSETTTQVATGVANVTKAGDTLVRIVESAGNLQSMVQQIATATEEMSVTSQTVTDDIDAIARVSQETSAGATQMAQTATDLTQLSTTLLQAVGRFNA
jgi:methyl-accepting chemotaxis protein